MNTMGHVIRGSDTAIKPLGRVEAAFARIKKAVEDGYPEAFVSRLADESACVGEGWLSLRELETELGISRMTLESYVHLHQTLMCGVRMPCGAKKGYRYHAKGFKKLRELTAKRVSGGEVLRLVDEYMAGLPKAA